MEILLPKQTAALSTEEMFRVPHLLQRCDTFLPNTVAQFMIKIQKKKKQILVIQNEKSILIYLTVCVQYIWKLNMCIDIFKSY